MISIKMARHAEKSCVMHIYICTYIYIHVCVCIVMHFISYWFLHHAKRPQATWHHRLRRRWIQEIKVHQIVDAQLFQGQHLNLGRSFRDSPRWDVHNSATVVNSTQIRCSWPNSIWFAIWIQTWVWFFPDPVGWWWSQRLWKSGRRWGAAKPFGSGKYPQPHDIANGIC